MVINELHWSSKSNRNAFTNKTLDIVNKKYAFF